MSIKLAIYTPLLSKLQALYLSSLTSEQHDKLEVVANIMSRLQEKLGNNIFTNEELDLWREANDIVCSIEFPPQF